MSTSNLKSPQHTYVNPGIYTVSLKVTDHGVTNHLTRTAYITATVPLIVTTYSDPVNTSPITGGGPYHIGASVTVDALGSVSGSNILTLDHWTIIDTSGTNSPTDNPHMFTVISDTTAIAHMTLSVFYAPSLVIDSISSVNSLVQSTIYVSWLDNNIAVPSASFNIYRGLSPETVALYDNITLADATAIAFARDDFSGNVGYVDTLTSVPSAPYYYKVTAVSASGLESSMSTNTATLRYWIFSCTPSTINVYLDHFGNVIGGTTFNLVGAGLDSPPQQVFLSNTGSPMDVSSNQAHATEVTPTTELSAQIFTANSSMQYVFYHGSGFTAGNSNIIPVTVIITTP